MSNIKHITFHLILLGFISQAQAVEELTEKGLSQVDLIQQKEPEIIVVNPDEATSEDSETIEVTVEVPWDGQPRNYANNAKTEEMAASPEDKEAFEEARKRFLELELANSRYAEAPQKPSEPTPSLPVVNKNFDGGNLTSTEKGMTLTIPYTGPEKNFSTPNGAISVSTDPNNQTISLNINLPNK